MKDHLGPWESLEGVGGRQPCFPFPTASSNRRGRTLTHPCSVLFGLPDSCFNVLFFVAISGFYIPISKWISPPFFPNVEPYFIIKNKKRKTHISWVGFRSHSPPPLPAKEGNFFSSVFCRHRWSFRSSLWLFHSCGHSPMFFLKIEFVDIFCLCFNITQISPCSPPLPLPTKPSLRIEKFFFKEKEERRKKHHNHSSSGKKSDVLWSALTTPCKGLCFLIVLVLESAWFIIISQYLVLWFWVELFWLCCHMRCLSGSVSFTLPPLLSISSSSPFSCKN